MAKKILMAVQMRCQKCRSKALQIAATADALISSKALEHLDAASGVNFVGLEGEQKDKVVVIGDGVDATEIALRLRKKVGYANLISVTDVKSSSS